MADLPLLELQADSGETFAVDNPATGETVHEVPRMGAAETERALNAAEEALPAWRGLLAKERARIMRRWADLMLEHTESLARLMTIEQGKPLAEARVEIEYAASFLEWFGEEAKRVYGDTIPTYMHDRRIVVTKQPVGFTSEEEAIRQANDTPYGLAAYFFSRDLGRVWRVSEGLEYGIVGINTGVISTEVAPFGGVKESGIGREGSKYGIEEWLELKYLCMGGIDA